MSSLLSWEQIKAIHDARQERFLRDRSRADRDALLQFHLGPMSNVDFLASHPMLHEVSALDFYYDLFRRLPLEETGQLIPGEYCGIIQILDLDAKAALDAERERLYALGDEYWITNKRGKKIRDYRRCDAAAYRNLKDQGITTRITSRAFITRDMEYLEDILDDPGDKFYFTSPISYAGRQRSKKCARYLYAVALEIDDLRMNEDGCPVGLANMFTQFTSDYGLPTPQYIVWSGNGVHVYFVLQTPVPLFPGNARSLNAARKELVRRFWNSYVTDSYREKDIQYETVFQGFRLPGTKTKKGIREHSDEVARVFRCELPGDCYTLEELFSWLSEEQLKKFIRMEQRPRKTLPQLQQAYPDWYDRHFTPGGKPRKNPVKKHYITNRAFFESFRKKILEETEEGHRYKALTMLASAGVKCGLSYDEIADELQMVGEELQKKKCARPLTAGDIMDAIDSTEKGTALFDYRMELMCDNAGVTPYERKKRNGRKRPVHLAICRNIRDIQQMEAGTTWTAGNGRKPQQETVQQWRQQHPDGKKADCIRDTGLSKPTVYKWWDS